LEQKTDDLQLFVHRPGGAPCAGRLDGQMKRRGSALSEPAVRLRSENEQLADGSRASRTHCPMERCRTFAVHPLDVRSVLDEKTDQPRLRFPAPRNDRPRPRVARVVQRGGAPAILSIWVGPCAKQEPGLVGTQGRSREMKARIAHVQPVRNRFDQMVVRHSSAATLGRGSKQSFQLLPTLKDRLENWLHRCWRACWRGSNPRMGSSTCRRVSRPRAANREPSRYFHSCTSASPCPFS
jgi:hypothetical protein